MLLHAPGAALHKQKKPMKVSDATAQVSSLSLSAEALREDQIDRSISSMIGSLILRGLWPLSSLACLIPACTLLRMGSDD